MADKPQPGFPIPESLRPFLNEEQDPDIVRLVHDRVQQILTPGESILYIAVQKKPLVNISPDSVILTNKRFIAYRPTMLGRVSFQDYPWRDLLDARLKEGVIGATLTLKTVKGVPIVVDYLPKAQARRLYSSAQEMEERVREERRVRELEERRASAGGVVLHGPPAASNQSSSPAPPSESPVQRLRALKEMLDAELISPGEYEAKRAEIIAKM